MKSPWDLQPDENTDAVESIADDDAETTPLSAQEESQVWKSRAHQLWETARRDGNTQAQASAITVALRHLAAAEKVAAEKSPMKLVWMKKLYEKLSSKLWIRWCVSRKNTNKNITRTATAATLLGATRGA
jgi:hypothetical protein